MGLRPVDLARAAGISAQQVRNYLDAGVLPPAERSPAGYRVFDERHRRALTTYRALGRGYGWEAAKAIMRLVHAGSSDAAVARVDAEHAAAHGQRLGLRATAEALEAVAREAAGVGREVGAEAVGVAREAGVRVEAGRRSVGVPRAGLRVGELAARLGVRPSALRVWEAAGLLAPGRDRDGHRRFGPTEVRDARLVAMLRQSRYPLPAIKPIMDEFRSSGGAEALRAAITAREVELGRRARAMLEGAAALHGYLAVVSPAS
ncbi:DNA-binding transcriptional MerR regulator [Saccharothrix carnea]|uniref:DNA-binding transcriptional MerR regulator n=1 Tax=Saccharothrix carnea TaxID=1280637 RepID=A0A2P8I563_SACCR|nr:MerR family transcriptional regulator [Saccharothrix carnea]PSL53604.1 DNA-binding transcriptional MerR regulator [Saccharothrix carnea]